MKRFQPALILGLAVLGVGVLLGQQTWPSAQAAGAQEPTPAAVERARSTAKMLDDLYKNFVVQITSTYVKARERMPAARVAQKVFAAMHDKGWHKGRLVDASGDPFNVDNIANTPFEKKAVAAMKAGKPYVDEVASEKGQPVLRVATVVPAVMKECLACHTRHKEGDLLGAIVYEIPIK